MKNQFRRRGLNPKKKLAVGAAVGTAALLLISILQPLPPAQGQTETGSGTAEAFELTSGKEVVGQKRGAEVVKMDLDADLNHEGTVGDSEEHEDDAPGLLVGVGYSAKIKLKGEPAETAGGKVILTAATTGGHVKVEKLDGTVVINTGESDFVYEQVLSAGDTLGSLLPMELVVVGLEASAGIGDVSLELSYEDAEGKVAQPPDGIVMTIIKAEFIDDVTDYALETNTDSDNHFLRREDDHRDLDVYYSILPSGVLVDAVTIKIYKGDSPAVIDTISGETDAFGDFKTGVGLHVTWTAPAALSTSDPGFYSVTDSGFRGWGRHASP